MLRSPVESTVAFILTSRPTDELAREFQHLSRFELASFSPEQQSELAARWLGQRASDFERAFDRFANGELGGTPLLLTIAGSSIVMLGSYHCVAASFTGIRPKYVERGL